MAVEAVVTVVAYVAVMEDETLEDC